MLVVLTELAVLVLLLGVARGRGVSESRTERARGSGVTSCGANRLVVRVCVVFLALFLVVLLLLRTGTACTRVCVRKRACRR